MFPESLDTTAERLEAHDPSLNAIMMNLYDYGSKTIAEAFQMRRFAVCRSKTAKACMSARLASHRLLKISREPADIAGVHFSMNGAV